MAASRASAGAAANVGSAAPAGAGARRPNPTSPMAAAIRLRPQKRPRGANPPHAAARGRTARPTAGGGPDGAAGARGCGDGAREPPGTHRDFAGESATTQSYRIDPRYVEPPTAKSRPEL